MWWMWHGEIGHWVVNRSPGSHSDDLAKSEFDDFALPTEVDWDSLNPITVTEEAPPVRPEWAGPDTIYISKSENGKLFLIRYKFSKAFTPLTT